MSETHDCPHQDDLQAVIQGLLDDQRLESQITAHLGTCANCQRLADELAGWSKVADAAHDYEEAKPGDSPALNAVVARLVQPRSRVAARESLAERLLSEESRTDSRREAAPGGGTAKDRHQVTRRVVIAGLTTALTLSAIVIAILWSRAKTPANRFVQQGERFSRQPVGARPRPAPAPETTAGDRARCVVLATDGSFRLKTRGLAHAIAAARPNEVIEIEHTGLVTIESASVNVPLTIRAADDARPVISRPSTSRNPSSPLINCSSDLTIRGVNFIERGDRRPAEGESRVLIAMHSGALKMSECDVEMMSAGFEEIAILVTRSASLEIEKCRFLGGIAVDSIMTAGSNINIKDSLLHGAVPIVLRHGPTESPTNVTLQNATVVSETAIAINLEDSVEITRRNRQLRISIHRSVVMARDSFVWINRVNSGQRRGVAEAVAANTHRNVVDWRLSRSVLAIGNRYLSHDRSRMPLQPANQQQLASLARGSRVTELSAWVEAVDAEDDGSVEVDFALDDALLRPVSFQDLRLLEMSLLEQIASPANPDRE